MQARKPMTKSGDSRTAKTCKDQSLHNSLSSRATNKEFAMTRRPRHGFRAPFPAFALAMLCPLTLISTQFAQAQALTVLHTFTAGNDGANPFGGLTLDRAGSIYGTASVGDYNGQGCSPAGCGTVYQLKH